MQVNSVSNYSINQKSFGNRALEQAVYQEFANMDDRTLRKLATQTASEQVNDKKHNRITNAILWSIPLAAGLAAGVAVTGGRVPMLKTFAKTAASWMASFAGMELVFGGKRALNNNSESARNFDRKHPILSSIATFGVAIGAMMLGAKGVDKLISKYGKNVVDFAKKLKIDSFVKNNKLVNKSVELVKKVPSAIKSFGKGVLGWSPFILAFTSIAHSTNHSKVKAVQTANNYTQLKEAQAEVRSLLNNQEV